MSGVNVQITNKIADILLRNGHEIPLSFYNEFRKNNPTANDNEIYDAYVQARSISKQRNETVANEGVRRELVAKEEEIRKNETTRETDESIHLKIEKAKYILEHPEIFSKTDINKAKKIFTL